MMVRTHLRTGVPMQMHVIKTRFVSGGLPGPKPGGSCLADRLPEVRRFLRTDMSLPDIALQLGVEVQALRSFIKRRRLCDMRARMEFISLQKSIKGEAIE